MVSFVGVNYAVSQSIMHHLQSIPVEIIPPDLFLQHQRVYSAVNAVFKLSRVHRVHMAVHVIPITVLSVDLVFVHQSPVAYHSLRSSSSRFTLHLPAISTVRRLKSRSLLLLCIDNEDCTHSAINHLIVLIVNILIYSHRGEPRRCACCMPYMRSRGSLHSPLRSSLRTDYTQQFFRSCGHC